MIPGELITDDGELELNAGRATVTVTVSNTGDRPATRQLCALAGLRANGSQT